MLFFYRTEKFAIYFELTFFILCQKFKQNKNEQKNVTFLCSILTNLTSSINAAIPTLELLCFRKRRDGECTARKKAAKGAAHNVVFKWFIYVNRTLRALWLGKKSVGMSGMYLLSSVCTYLDSVLVFFPSSSSSFVCSYTWYYAQTCLAATWIPTVRLVFRVYLCVEQNILNTRNRFAFLVRDLPMVKSEWASVVSMCNVNDDGWRRTLFAGFSDRVLLSWIVSLSRESTPSAYA